MLRYSVAPVHFPTQLLEVGCAVRIIRENAEKWKVDTQRIVVQGSSAGGHLAACYGAFWNQELLKEDLDPPAEEWKPGGMLLSGLPCLFFYRIQDSSQEWLHPQWAGPSPINH